jgi:hypothetical protein
MLLNSISKKLMILGAVFLLPSCDLDLTFNECTTCDEVRLAVSNICSSRGETIDLELFYCNDNVFGCMMEHNIPCKPLDQPQDEDPLGGL